MVEMAFVMPLFLFFVCGVVDFSRATLVLNQLSSAARLAARQLTLPNQGSSDCAALRLAIDSGKGAAIALLPDPNSVRGNLPPDSTGPANKLPTSPVTPGKGFVYLYPAMSRPPGAGQDQFTNDAGPTTADPGPPGAPAPLCQRRDSQGRETGTTVARVTYYFVPITPAIAAIRGRIVLSADSSQFTENR